MSKQLLGSTGLIFFLLRFTCAARVQRNQQSKNLKVLLSDLPTGRLNLLIGVGARDAIASKNKNIRRGQYASPCSLCVPPHTILLTILHSNIFLLEETVQKGFSNKTLVNSHQQNCFFPVFFCDRQQKQFLLLVQNSYCCAIVTSSVCSRLRLLIKLHLQLGLNSRYLLIRIQSLLQPVGGINTRNAFLRVSSCGSLPTSSYHPHPHPGCKGFYSSRRY